MRRAADRARSPAGDPKDHLGHKAIQTTFNVYGHLLPQAQQALAARLDDAYAGGSEPDNVASLRG